MIRTFPGAMAFCFKHVSSGRDTAPLVEAIRATSRVALPLAYLPSGQLAFPSFLSIPEWPRQRAALGGWIHRARGLNIHLPAADGVGTGTNGRNRTTPFASRCNSRRKSRAFPRREA